MVRIAALYWLGTPIPGIHSNFILARREDWVRLAVFFWIRAVLKGMSFRFLSTRNEKFG